MSENGLGVLKLKFGEENGVGVLILKFGLGVLAVEGPATGDGGFLGFLTLTVKNLSFTFIFFFEFFFGDFFLLRFVLARFLLFITFFLRKSS